MSDLTRYINLGCRHMSICDSVEKDTTLQDIADAWNKGYETADGPNVLRLMLRSEWPELAVLLDALGGTDNE